MRLRKNLGRSHDMTYQAWLEFLRVNAGYRNFAVNNQWEHQSNWMQNLGSKPKLFHAFIRRKKKGNPPVGPLKSGDSVIKNRTFFIIYLIPIK